MIFPQQGNDQGQNLQSQLARLHSTPYRAEHKKGNLSTPVSFEKAKETDSSGKCLIFKVC